MMILKRWILIFGFSLGVVTTGVGQSVDPYAIVNRLKTRVMEINDYQADMEIEVDVDFINMPRKHARIFFKQPDKIKFKSDEFFMMPKKGLNNSMMKIMSEPYTAIYMGEDTLSGIRTDIVKIIPMGKKPDIVLATWWISRKSGLMIRSESSTRNEGTFSVDFSYASDSIPLPSEMVFSFEVENVSLPMKFMGKTAGMEIDKTKMDGPQQGRVIIRFSNYQINQGIGDENFEDKEE